MPGGMRRLERIELRESTAELRGEPADVRGDLGQAAADGREALRLEQEIGGDRAGGRWHGGGGVSRGHGFELPGEALERRIERLVRFGLLAGEGFVVGQRVSPLR